MLLKITNMGERWNHTQRQRVTHIEEAVSVAPLYLMVKDHKKTDGSGPPPTRPVCGAISGMNVHFSNIISPYLDALADEMTDTMEVISTEDALSRINDYNAVLEREEKNSFPDSSEGETDEEEFLSQDELKLSQRSQNKQYNKDGIIGADVKSLFPSMKSKITSRLVSEAVLESDIMFEGIDYKEVVTYLSMNLSDFEMQKSKIRHLLPRKKGKRGPKAKVTGESATAAVSSHDKHWVYPRLTFTDSEKRILLGKALEVATYTLFTNHLYQFGGKYYRQTDGAPIGVRASMSASRVVMGIFDKRLKKIMKDNNLIVKTRLRYVDDLRLVMGLLREGWRWIGDRMVFRMCWQKEERTEKVDLEMKTAGEMKKIMDSIFSNLQFEMETPKMFENNRLPTLDFEMYTLREKIVYSYYQKPVAKKTLILRKSALGENVKVSSLTQNMIRRMKNTSEDVPDEERRKIVDNFYWQLKISGYSDEQSRKIIKAGLIGYEKLLLKCKQGNAKLHRSAEEGWETRKKKKLLGKSNWFKTKRRRGKNSFQKYNNNNKRNQSPEVVTVLFVNQTPNGALAKSLQKVESELSKLTNEKVKIVERSGTSVKQIFHKSNPWSGGNCGRKECLPCMNGDGSQNCFDKNVVYQISCLNCSEKKEAALYIGQTSRSLHERGVEHLQGLIKKQEDSPLFKHVSEVHQGVTVDFRMRVIRRHFSAFSRLVHEAVMINRVSNAGDISIMNSKGEYGRTYLPRLIIDDNKPDAETEAGAKNSLPSTVGDVIDINRESKDSKVRPERGASNNVSVNKLDSQSSKSNTNYNNDRGNQSSVISKPNCVGGAAEVKQNRKTYKQVSANFRKRKRS